MKLPPPTNAPGPPRRLPASRGKLGMSLVEMAVAVGVGSIVLVLVGLLALYGLRSFAVMGNYADLDEKGRLAVDKISRDLRQATGVLRYTVTADSKTLLLTNALAATTITYVWDAEAHTLTSEENGETPVLRLTDCESWNAGFFQDRPQPSVTLPFLPATNGPGKLDLGRARIITLSWTCSRTVSGMQATTDSAQSLQVVLRNSPQ
jgi:Tfp pilus assembly protein PilW